MELRQLRYFVTLAEELHFGRAAGREHIVQSALSQQLQRLERKLGILLLDRTTHHVQLTPAGRAFLVEARQILEHVNRAVAAAQRAGSSTPVLRVGVVDAGYDSMSQILCQMQEQYPELEIHQVEAGVPEQFRRLTSDRLDVGAGWASLAPPEVASELFRLDPLGVLVPEGHRLAASQEVPVAAAARDLGGPVGVVAAGERRPDGSLRPAVEDLIGAGAVLHALGGNPSPEARAAVATFLDAAPDLPAALATCASGLELAARGQAADLRLAAEHDVSRAVPRLSGGAFAQLS